MATQKTPLTCRPRKHLIAIAKSTPIAWNQADKFRSVSGVRFIVASDYSGARFMGAAPKRTDPNPTYPDKRQAIQFSLTL